LPNGQFEAKVEHDKPTMVRQLVAAGTEDRERSTPLPAVGKLERRLWCRRQPPPTLVFRSHLYDGLTFRYDMSGHVSSPRQLSMT
jgi:hypothetical protein